MSGPRLPASQRIASLSPAKQALLRQRLRALPAALADPAAQGRKDGLVAYVVPQPGKAIDPSELKQFLQSRLPDYMVPSAFVVLDELPLLPNGKVDRSALPQPALRPGGAGLPPEEGATPAERALLGLWREVLGREEVGPHDNFFELGGHSLLAAQLVSRIRQALGTELPLRALFESPTVAGLARRLEGGQEPGAPEAAAPAPLPPGAPRPLSFAQERLWVFEQLEPGLPVYNMPGAVRLSGPLDAAALERSLSEVARRHEVLRATFEDGSAFQRVAPPGPVALPRIDLGALPAPGRQAELARLLEEEARRPFDLRRGPPLRARLLRLEEREHVLQVTVHHLVSDGWSMGLLVRELAELYNAFLEGKGSPLPEPPVQYAGYAAWQRRRLRGPLLERELDYWKARLAGAPRSLDLPADRPRPPVQTYRGAVSERLLPLELAEAVRELARREGVTPFMALLAAFQAFLSRYARQEDVVVGSPVANRDRVELEGLIGCFLNTLVLRTAVSGELSFRQLLARVREVVLGAYAHQELPFEKLVEALHPERDPSRPPLFQVGFVLQNAEATLRPAQLRGLAMEPFEVFTGTVKYDLTLSLTETPGGLHAALQYNQDLFHASTVERMHGHFRTLLQGAVADPDRKVAELPLLEEEERRRLLGEWAGVEVPPAGEALVPRLFEAQAARTPGQVAVVCEGARLRYADLDRRANQLAHRLRALGVGPDARVAVCMERSLELVVSLLGVLKAGGAYVPLDPSYPRDRLAFMLEDSGAALLLTQEGLAARLPPGGARAVLVDPDGEAFAAERPEPPEGGAGPEDLAYLLYTSGSTGAPKGVAISHRALANHMRWMRERFPLDGTDAVLQKTPYSFDASVWEFWAPLLSGARLAMARPGGHRDGGYLIEALIEHDITVLQVVPSLLNALLDEPGFEACAALRSVFCGGEPLTPALRDRFHQRFPEARLVNLYGPTETTIDATFHLCEREGRPEVPIGRPISNVRAYVLDDRLQLVPPGVPGELFLGGQAVGRGYLARPALTAERFLPDPFSTQPGARLYRTGDLARHLADGALEYLGRRDQQLKVRGFRVEPGEIESCLQRHPGVGEAAVVARQGPGPGAQLVAYVVPAAQAEAAPSAPELAAFLQARLPEYLVPAAFVVLEAMPRTPGGKVDRAALPAPELAGARRRRDYTPPGTQAERALAEIWSRHLKLPEVGVHDDFFQLGGDSILAIQVVAAARREGLQLTPRQIFETPTIAALAPVAAAAAPAAAQEPVAGPVPLTPIQRELLAQPLPAPHHWNQSLLLELTERLEPARLEEALAAVAAHHDALRLRYRRGEAGWEQRCEPAGAEAVAVALERIELGPRTLEEAAAACQAGLELERGPVLRAALLESGARAWLLLVAHHLVVDGVSWRILLEDLVEAYRQRSAGQPARLPPKTTSFQAWARRLEPLARSGEAEAELEYWLSRPWTRAGPLPVDGPAAENTEGSARSHTVRLEAEETRALLQRVPEAYRTRAEELLVAALAAALGRWTGAVPVPVDLEGHGRDPGVEGVDLSRTVGWFTSVYPVLLTWAPGQPAGEALKAVKEQLRAIPRKGFGYGLLRHLGREEAAGRLRAAVPEAEVAFNYLGQLDQGLPEGAPFRLSRHPHGPARAPAGRRRYLLEIGAAVVDGRLEVEWTYGGQVHRARTIEALAASFVEALRALAAHCLSDGAGGLTPSDFPLVRLEQAWLDRWGAGRGIEDLYPLSPMQQGFWLYGQYAQGSGVGLEQTCYAISGELDVPLFEEAWRRTIARHAALRTGFASEGLPRPVQLVHRRAPLAVERHDWRQLDPAARRERLRAFLEDSRRQGFDLERPPLMRVAAIRTGDAEHQLVWSHHHLLLDGWSVPLVLREVVAHYGALREGRALELERPRPYRDFIAWQAREDDSGAEGYWRRALEGVTGPTPLVIDRACAALDPGPPGHREQELALSGAETAALQELARQLRVTPGLLVQAAWAVVLGRYSGQREVLFGTTVSGRPAELPGVERMVGLFINVVPTRVRLPAGATVAGWLRELQAAQVERQPHERIPLLQLQQWSQVPPALPLFESLVIYENYPDRGPELEGPAGGLAVLGIDASVHTRYPLTLVAVPGASLKLYAAHDARHLTAAAAARLLGHLKSVLLGFVAAPEGTLAAVPLLAEDERRQLRQWGERSGGPRTVLLDDELRPVPVGIPGGVYLEDPLGGPAAAPHATGERARYLPDGAVQSLGGADAALTVRSVRVAAPELEAVLDRQPGVRASAVATRPGAGGEELVALLEVDPAAPPAPARLRAALGERLPAYLLPAAFEPVPALPRRPGGALDRAAVARLAAGARASSAPAPLGTPTEEALARIWRELVGAAELGPEVDFFQLGGQSLVALQMLSRVRTELGVELPIRQIFEGRTLGEIARRIDALQAQAAGAPPRSIFERSPLVKLPPEPHSELSPYQYPEWYFSELAPDSPMYNILSCDILFEGELDREAMRRAWETVVNRHGVFRTTFGYADGKAVQRIGPPWTVRLEDITLDYRHVPEDRFLEESTRLAHEFAETALDFRHGPMFHLKLAEFPGRRHLLVFLTNHVLWDEVSSINMSAELREAYNAYRAGREPRLPELALDYVDYARWVNHAVEAGLLEREKRYWVELFADQPPPLELPTDFPRPPEQTFNGSDVAGAFPRETTARILDVFLAERRDVTLSVFLHAVFNLLLHRLSGQRDIVIGVPIANRDDPRLERVMGPFATGMPMRCSLQEGMTFEELLAHTRDRTLEAIEHHAYPSVHAIQDINPGWDVSRGRLFSVMYGLQHNKTRFWSEMRLDGMTTHRMEHLANIGPLHSTSRCDLRLIAEELGPDILFSMAYNSDLYRRSTIERMVEQYLSLAAQVLEAPARRLGEYRMLSPADQRLLQEVNATAAPLPAEAHFADRFEAQVDQTPEAPALLFEEERWSYRRLDEAANRWAHELIAAGVGAEDKVGLLLDPCPDLAVAVLAILKAGACYVPIIPSQPPRRMEAILEGAGARVLLTHRSQPAASLRFGGTVLWMDEPGAGAAARPAERPRLPRHPRQLAMVFFTSGTTGTPKGIEIEHRGILNLLACTQREYRLEPGEATLLSTAFNFDASILELFWPLAVGARLALPRAEECREPAALARAIDRHGVAVLQTVPMMLGALVDARLGEELSGLPSLRVVMCAGAALTRGLRDRFTRAFGSRLANHYGPTETTVDATRFDARLPFDGETVSIGRPISNTRVYVLDPRLRPAPLGVPGELHVSSVGAARGYLGDPAKTAAAFLPDPFSSEPGARMYRTGDQGRFTGEGLLSFVGRVDRQVKVRGNRVELEEIEARLSAHPAVGRCAVRHRPAAAGGGDTLIAFVEPREGASAVRAGERTFRVFTLAQRPELKNAMDVLHAEAWPAYFAGDEVQRRCWPRLAAEHPGYQLALVDEEDRLAAVGNTIPIRWDGTPEDLPAGWDGGLERACREAEEGIAPGALLILAGVVSREAEGQGLATAILSAFKGLARARGLERVIVPVRPTGKAAHPELEFEAWCRRRRPDGQAEDHWLRVHERAGARVLKYELRSQRVRAELGLWEAWTGRRFTASGPHHLPDALAPVMVNLEEGWAEYFDPSVWMEHPASAGQAAALDPVDGRALQEHLRELLPEYMVPEHFRFVRALPLTSSGKIDARRLPEVELALAPRGPPVPPQTPMQERLLQLWREVLKADGFGVTDDFFELGGHSIRAMQLLAKAADAFGVRLPLRELFRSRTIRELERAILAASGQ